eukprot:TRINITY_DN53864_c0_g1_i1.p1 TRINITY_DN53864_c0_g1~~TRINITY_DN53864_c0_g1_i1.p1  ORF type:complete len:153 (+),score=17.06 TRINITY_DN53864_c0_g1_i1:39-497(+)
MAIWGHSAHLNAAIDEPEWAARQGSAAGTEIPNCRSPGNRHMTTMAVTDVAGTVTNVAGAAAETAKNGLRKLLFRQDTLVDNIPTLCAKASLNDREAKMKLKTLHSVQLEDDEPVNPVGGNVYKYFALRRFLKGDLWITKPFSNLRLTTSTE